MSEKIDKLDDSNSGPAAAGAPAGDASGDTDDPVEDNTSTEEEEPDEKPSSPEDYEPDESSPNTAAESEEAVESEDNDLAPDDDDSTPDELDDTLGHGDTHKATQIAPLFVAPTIATAFNTLGLDLIPVACLAMQDILFAFGSSFVLPGAAKVLNQLPAIRENRKNLRGEFAPVSIFGHADPVGTDDLNKALSGRRAHAVYAVLTKDTKVWSNLLNSPSGGDNWQTVGAVSQMRSATGLGASTPTSDLIAAYMTFLCPVTVPKSEFLGQGSDPGGKADFQGCSEFNPIVVLSTSENNLPADQRNSENQPNRRVVIFFFRQRPKVNAQLWPCPRASEGTADCRKRFFLKGDERRAPGPERRNFADKRDTFACRFYDRIANVSPCEGPPPPPVFQDVNPVIAFTGTVKVPVEAAAAIPASAPDKAKADDAKPAPEPLPPSAPTIGPARKIVVMKKPHTNPARVVVLLKTDALFTGKGTFTVAPTDEIKFFKRAKRGKPLSFGGDNVFSGKALTKGVTVFAEGVKASAAFDNVELRLALAGGNKKPGPDATAKMTCVEATLTIHTPRPADGSEPKPLAEDKKLKPGRSVHIQDKARHQRAKLIVQVKPTSATVKMNAVVKPSNDKIKFFDSEKAGTDLGATATLLVDATFPAKGKLVFAEGVKVSDKFRDTTVTLGLQALEDDADHVTMTVIQAQLDIGRARTAPTTDPVLFSAADKQNLGRFLMLQNAKKHASRATLIVQRIKPADFPGIMLLAPFRAKDKVRIFNAEKSDKGEELKTPIKISNAKLSEKGQKFFAEGAVLSAALIDAGCSLDVQDVQDAADFVSCTVISLRLEKIETSELAPGGGGMVFKSDDDFAPRLGEQAKFHVKIDGNLPGFNATVRVAVGRRTNRADRARTSTVNESITIVANVNQANTPGKAEVEVNWNGKATVAADREFSDRTARNVNNGRDVRIPLNAVAATQFVPHGLYVVDQVTLLQGAEVLAIDRPEDADLSVPILANLIFNANWAADLAAFGLTPFRDRLEEGLRRFGGRDYMIRDAALANRMNVRFITNAGITNADSIRNSVGGPDPAGGGLFGSTPDGPAPLADNLFAFFDGISADITIFPSTFLLFNNTGNIPDRTAFRGLFAPLGVRPGQTVAAPGTATARAVDGAGNVTGGCTALDSGNVTVALDNDGMATVTTTNAAVVPAARATDIQAALQAFVRMVGNTTNHETAHGLGVVSRVRVNNRITIRGIIRTSPLNGDGGAHNRVTANTNIVDGGNTRSFVRRIEAAGQPQQRFNATNTTYLRNCIPFDTKDN